MRRAGPGPPPSLVNPIVGWLGGHSVYRVGSPEDLEAFFQWMRGVLSSVGAGPRLFPRLYRGYFPLALLPEAEAWMVEFRREVGNAGTMPSSIPPELPELLFSGFARAAASARSFQAEFGAEQPVRLVRADPPAFFLDKKRPLAEYDALTGVPFWLRP